MSSSLPGVSSASSPSDAQVLTGKKSAFAQHFDVPPFLRVLSVLRIIWILFVAENPLFWWWRQGKNPRADLEGPFYLIGAPDRQYGEGKAVLASVEELRAFPPFLILISVRTPHGDPVPHARFSWWQADTNGQYAMSSYARRGTFTTDAQGDVEVLTVAPGAYGPPGHLRAAHFHMCVDPPQGGIPGCTSMTTQVYVCPSNDAKVLQPDLINYLRAPRTANVMHSWCVPKAAGGEAFMGLPALSAEDTDLARKLDWWNARIADETGDASVQIVAGGSTVFSLTAR